MQNLLVETVLTRKWKCFVINFGCNYYIVTQHQLCPACVLFSTSTCCMWAPDLVDRAKPNHPYCRAEASAQHVDVQLVPVQLVPIKLSWLKNRGWIGINVIQYRIIDTTNSGMYVWEVAADYYTRLTVHASVHAVNVLRCLGMDRHQHARWSPGGCSIICLAGQARCLAVCWSIDEHSIHETQGTWVDS